MTTRRKVVLASIAGTIVILALLVILYFSTSTEIRETLSDLGAITLALNKYKVEHGGQYPAALTDLVDGGTTPPIRPYLAESVLKNPFINGSPKMSYLYTRPAPGTTVDAVLVRTNGSVSCWGEEYVVVLRRGIIVEQIPTHEFEGSNQQLQQH